MVSLYKKGQCAYRHNWETIVFAQSSFNNFWDIAGIWLPTNTNDERTFVAKSPQLNKGESSYVVCWGQWIVPNSEIKQGKNKLYTLDTWRAELLEEGIRVFVIYRYNFEGKDGKTKNGIIDRTITDYAIKALVQKMPEEKSDNIMLTCGVEADIDNIDKLESYLSHKYGVQQKQVSYLLFCGHGGYHTIQNANQAYSLAVPYLKAPKRNYGFVGDLFDPPKSSNGLCQQSTEDYVKCFSNLLKDNAIVTLLSCSSSAKYDIGMPILGTASMAKRVKYYLTQNGGAFNVVGFKGSAVSYPERYTWFTDCTIPFRPEYMGKYVAGDE